MENITVIGIGKLGLGFALLLENAGYNICGVDIFNDYVDKLNNKQYKSLEHGYNDMLKSSNNFFATTDLKIGLNHSDIIFIIVQTPNSGGDKYYDHSILSNLLFKINRYKVSNKNLIIGCTVMPTYIDKIGKSLILDCNNTHLSYNPEFVAQGEIIHGFKNPDIVLLGTHNTELPNIIENIYRNIIKKDKCFRLCILTPLEAEIVKISLNGYITTKLSYANMISDVCDQVGANKECVLESIGYDSRIGNKYFKPGYSFGGPCFPRDTKALKLFVDKCNINSDILSGTTKMNEEHVLYQANQLLNLSNMKNNINNINIKGIQYINDNKYTIENVCYKEGVDIPLIEESAKLKIAKILVDNGKTIIIKDNELTINEVRKEYGDMFQYHIINE